MSKSPTGNSMDIIPTSENRECGVIDAGGTFGVDSGDFVSRPEDEVGRNTSGSTSLIDVIAVFQTEADENIGEDGTFLGADTEPREMIGEDGTLVGYGTLGKLPLELRREIWKLLLFNPALGYAKGFTNLTQPQYELEPVILRVSRKINEETCKVLYGDNKFFFVGIKQLDCPRYTIDLFNRCPLTRYHTRDPWNKEPPRFVSLDKVRQWRLIIGSIEIWNDTSARWNLGAFVREICDSATPPASLEIVVISEQSPGIVIQDTWNKSPPATRGSIPTAEDLMKDLYPLRNIGKIKFFDAKPDDCPVWQRPGTLWEPHIIPVHEFKNVESRQEQEDSPDFVKKLPIEQSVQDELERLIMGNTPRELLHDMNRRLLTYARTFERHIHFKMSMGRNRSHIPIGQKVVAEEINQMVYYDRVPLEEARQIGAQYNNETFWLNPFFPMESKFFGRRPRQMYYHPVEFGLELCNVCVQNNDSAKFKIQRALVIQYLERQYLRILSASKSVICHIASEKRQGRLFDPNRERDLNEPYTPYRPTSDEDEQFAMGEGLCVLEDYADSFRRELTFHTRLSIAKMRNEFYGYYDAMEREKAIKDVYEAIKDPRRGYDYESYKKGFRKAVDDMEEQLLEIQEARRGIFEDDKLGERGCDIDVNLGRVDERIVWDVLEPRMGPEREFYPQPSTVDGWRWW
ncbi:hypothetical protein NHQ30_011435 [Ciborinia camelliae]|nr:hypothetical protein NHQ30_011435 [Ciborinia camelliae]